MKQIAIAVILCFTGMIGFTQNIPDSDFSDIFNKYGVDGCFVLFNESNQEYIRYHSALCDTGYIPASTFKIPNSLIALEEGVVKDTTQIFRWDGHVWPNKNWNRDQTLKTAMKYSCVWVYVGIAAQIGIEKYQHYVNAFNYGNMNLTGPPTRFWLNGLLRISANQQLEFLRKFYHNQLPQVSNNSIDMVKDIIILEQNDHYRFSGKTGGGMLNDTDYIMWLVGYLEKDEKVYYYAMNFISDDYERTSQARYEIVKDILKRMKVME